MLQQTGKPRTAEAATPPSDESTMTELEVLSRQGMMSAASLMTQSVKKQPRSPRDKQASPKRARVGAGVEADEQDDASTSTEPVLDEKQDDGAQHQAGEELAGTSGTTVFSPVFHCMRTLRSSLDAAHPQDTDQQPTQDTEEHPQQQVALRHAAWIVQDGTQHITDHLEPQGEQPEEAGSELPPHHAASEHIEGHHSEGHHHIIPEASEHELPPDNPEVEEELDYMDFDPLLFIKLLPPLEQVVPKHRPPLLPRKTRLCKQKTLVLDLDETLVHSCLEAQAVSDFTFPVHFNSQEHIIHVRQRPHLHTFMQRVAELYEVVVFTASQKIYAEKLLNIIDPERKLIKHRIFRESCVVVDGNYLKDLTALGRDLRTTLIVDNSPQAFGFQVDNGVPIESWYDDVADTELLKLLPFLESIVTLDDVRPAIRNKFRMRELIDRVVC